MPVWLNGYRGHQRVDASTFKAVKQVIAILDDAEQNNETSTNMLDISLNYVKQIGLIKQTVQQDMKYNSLSHAPIVLWFLPILPILYTLH